MRKLIFNVKFLMLNPKFKIQNSKLPRSGFTMVELIFVIVLMGILASVGGNLLPDNRLLQYTNEVTTKIKEAQKNAIGNDVNGFGIPWKNLENNSTCVDSNISSHVESFPKFCFDEYGRPYQSERLLLENLDISVKYNNKTNKISVMPISGYVILNN